MRALESAVVAMVAVSCTKPNPTYCEVPSDCESGACEMHTCVEAPDADPDAPDADPNAPDAGSSCTSKIGWISNRTGYYNVFTADPDGTGLLNVTESAHGSSLLSTFAWAPDGRRIAYLGQDGLRVVDADGTANEPLVSGSIDISFAWSPDGTIIVFERYIDDGRSEIWRIGSNGTPAAIRLSTSGDFHSSAPRWSPDGQQIAFVTNRDGNHEIYTMSGTGGNPTNLTDHSSDDGNGGGGPQWSPDGTKIAFISERTGNRDIWAMNADGSEPRNLTLSTADESHVRWSPDGATIFYDVAEASHVHLYAMNADGSNQHALEEETGIDEGAEVSPDGARIVWQSNRGDGNDNTEIYVADADGSHVQRVTSDIETDKYPAWQPCP